MPPDLLGPRYFINLDDLLDPRRLRPTGPPYEDRPDPGLWPPGTGGQGYHPLTYPEDMKYGREPIPRDDPWMREYYLETHPQVMPRNYWNPEEDTSFKLRPASHRGYVNPWRVRRA